MSSLPTYRAQGHDDGHYSFFQLHRHHPKEPVDNKRRLALALSYAPDWIVTIIVAGLFYLLDSIDGFKREFSLEDTTIQHTFAVHERVSTGNLFLISLIAPLVIMAFINVISIRSFWDLHASWLGVILSLAITGSITNVIKVTVGRPRPDSIDRCQPQAGATNHPVFGLVNATICTQADKAILKDGFKSFPSGHSSLSFAGLGFLSFYLAGKLHLFDKRGHTAKAWISIAPLIGATLVAISRTMDYRHHYQDVFIGSLLGMFFAWFAYRQYYPPLSHPLSHRPYSPRGSISHGSENLQHEENHRLNVKVDASDPESPPSELRAVWRQGEGEVIMPLGQGPSRPADEHV